MQPDRAPTPESREQHDFRWHAEACAAAGYVTFLVLLAVIVHAVGPGLTVQHATAWGALGTVVFVILVPPRVSTAPGRLTVRGLTARRTVRTDRLVSLRWPVGVSQRIAL